MPVTPFHFGPGLLAKSIAPTHFSMTAYCSTQVVIDLESGYHLIMNDWPVHRTLHTFLVGGLVGVGVGVVVGVVGAWVASGRTLSGARSPGGELSWVGALVGGVTGGWGHALLDGIMHTDIRPFMSANPLLGLVSVSTLHLACIVTGALGSVLWAARAVSRRVTA